MENNPHRNRIPYLFQIFIEVFGGFYGNHDQRDLAALADVTQIRVSDLPTCLALFDQLFPTTGSWFYTSKDLRMMKMVPAVYHGTGSFLRQGLFQGMTYEQLYPKQAWLVSRWHNALYKTLETKLGTASSQSAT